MGTIVDKVRRFVGGNEDASAPVQAIWGGRVIAESTDTVKLEGNHYFPESDVDFDDLEPSPRKSVCPWKGVASYYDVVVDGERNAGAAWHYPKPGPLARRIKGRIAFWQGVEVRRAQKNGRED